MLDEDIVLPGMEDFELAIAAEPIGNLPTLIFESGSLRRSGWIFMRVVLPEPGFQPPVVTYHRLD